MERREHLPPPLLYPCHQGIWCRWSPEGGSFEKAAKSGAWNTQCPLAAGHLVKDGKSGRGTGIQERCAQRGWMVTEAEAAWSSHGKGHGGGDLIRQIMGGGELLGRGDNRADELDLLHLKLKYALNEDLSSPKPSKN